MKVLHVLASNRFSGAENVVCQIIDMFRKDDDIEMGYCSPNGPIKDALEDRNITFFPLEKLTKKELKRAIDEYRPDVIHAHDMRASFAVARACEKIPFVSHIHNNAFNSRGISLKSIAFAWAAKKAARIFWVSKSSFEGYAFHESLKNKSTVLYNVIDVQALYEKMNKDKSQYQYDVVYIGRLTYQKNPQRLMNVFRLLKERCATIKMAVIGTGKLEQEVKQLANEYGLLDNVDFLGFQSNPLKILHDAKALVLTSRWEGTPMCALESMALGTPIVSTSADGLKDLIVNGENGFLCDTDEELADKVMEIVGNESLHNRFVLENQKKSIEINDIEQYKAVLKESYDL